MANQSSSKVKNEPIFVGNYGLVSFDVDPGPGDLTTVWLIDKGTKKLRPFANAKSFENFFADDPAAAWKRIVRISPDELDENGALSGFKLLNEDYGINESGVLKEDPNDQIRERYGKPLNTDAETVTYKFLGGDKTHPGLLKLLASSGEVSEKTINNILKDPAKVSKLISAMAYGEYEVNDVLREIKRQELADNGDQAANSMVVISPSLSRSDFVSTSEYRTSNSYPLLNINQALGGIDPEMFKYSIFKLPPEVFKELVPTLDMNSPEFKDEMSKVKSAYYDVILRSLDAQNEQEKAVADYAWEKYKESVKDKYNIELSNNATTAWNQLQTLEKTFSDRNIMDSGLRNEAMDRYLAGVRKSNELLRTQGKDEKETEEAKWYRSYASPEDIQKIINEDKAAGIADADSRAVRWGLVPDADTKKWFSKENLKSLYPDLSDEEIDRYSKMVLDDNGNFRSSVYQNYFGSRSEIEAAYRGFKRDLVYSNALEEEKKAAKPYTTQENPFIGDTETPAPSSEAPDVPTAEKPSTSSDSSTWTIANPAAKSAVPARDLAKEQASLAEWGKVYGKMPSTSQEWADFNKFTYNQPSAPTSSGKKITAYTPEGKAVSVNQGTYYPGLTSAPKSTGNTQLTPPKPRTTVPTTPTYATQWDPTKGLGSREKMKVGDPFKTGYKLYTGNTQLTPPKPQTNVPTTPTYATQWNPTKGLGSREKMKVGDPFKTGYKLYTGK